MTSVIFFFAACWAICLPSAPMTISPIFAGVAPWLPPTLVFSMVMGGAYLLLNQQQLMVEDQMAVMATRQQARIPMKQMAADIRRAAASDAIEDTLDYKAVAKRLIGFVEASDFGLVETLAEHIARIVVTEFDVPRVKVTLHKPGAVRGSKDVGIMIERAAADYAEDDADG